MTSEWRAVTTMGSKAKTTQPKQHAKTNASTNRGSHLAGTRPLRDVYYNNPDCTGCSWGYVMAGFYLKFIHADCKVHRGWDCI